MVAAPGPAPPPDPATPSACNAPNGIGKKVPPPLGAARLGREFLAAAGAPGVQHLAAAGGRHARAETVAALAHKLAGLICPLHNVLQAPRRVHSRAQPARRGG